MRRALTFLCEGSTLHATLDQAVGKTGLLIVSGGNEIRIGAHRGLAKLAAELAAAGYPVFRFDRRGIGDSEGVNGGFESSAADLEAAILMFRANCPVITSIVAFGNCDAASALMLHRPTGLASVVIANPWVIEPEAGLPPPAAVRAHYRARLTNPKALLGLFTGAVDFKKLVRGLAAIARTPAPSTLAHLVAEGMKQFDRPITILLAARDGTACAFSAEWDKPIFTKVRKRADISVIKLDSGSHSFASDSDYRALRSAILDALAQ